MLIRKVLIALAILAASVTALSQAEKPRYEKRANHDPNGIGKFYMGREIAQVMGHEGAEWLERPEREQEENPTKIIAALKLKPGMVVADIGAGSGYYSFRMAPQVAPAGKVYAQDIQPEMLQIVRNKMRQTGIRNVVPWLGTVTDTKLPANSIDLMLLVDVYHEFDFPYEMVQNMLKALKVGGKLVFVEFRLEDENVPIKLVHKMSEVQVKKEMAVHPLEWVETNKTLPWQHVITFKKVEPKAPR